MKKELKNIHARDLLKLIPEDDFASIIKETNVDFQVKKLFGRTMFFLLLYGLLDSKRSSLRTLEQSFKTNKFKVLFNIDPLKEIKFNSLSDRLSTMNVDFFKEVYEMIYELLSKYYNESEILKYNIVRVDSTMVAEAANKLEKGMTLGNQTDKKSKQIKYTFSMTNLFPSSAEIFTSQKEANEGIAIPQVIKNYIDKKENNVFVFDRGVKSRKVFNEIDEDYWFVTRINVDSNYEIINSFNHQENIKIGNLNIKSDDLVYLFDKRHNKSKPFRLIQTKDHKNKELWFLTNLENEDVETIISIYKKRWDIEVFFRFIKQELHFKHIFSTKINGLKILLYMTMIVAMLILVYKKANNMGYKLAMFQLFYQLDDIYGEMLVERLGGDPSLVFR
ncbi:MAG TPA: IS4 family transposase [Bacteroidales bacterium]|nr:IS4 family transposase [Bacteroidales bacterium]